MSRLHTTCMADWGQGYFTRGVHWPWWSSSLELCLLATRDLHSCRYIASSGCWKVDVKPNCCTRSLPGQSPTPLMRKFVVLQEVELRSHTKSVSITKESSVLRRTGAVPGASTRSDLYQNDGLSAGCRTCYSLRAVDWKKSIATLWRPSTV